MLCRLRGIRDRSNGEGVWSWNKKMKKMKKKKKKKKMKKTKKMKKMKMKMKKMIRSGTV